MQGLNNRLSFSIDLSSFGEYYFCVADDEVAGETQEWLFGSRRYYVLSEEGRKDGKLAWLICIILRMIRVLHRL